MVGLNMSLCPRATVVLRPLQRGQRTAPIHAILQKYVTVVCIIISSKTVFSRVFDPDPA